MLCIDIPTKQQATGSIYTSGPKLPTSHHPPSPAHPSSAEEAYHHIRPFSSGEGKPHPHPQSLPGHY